VFQDEKVRQSHEIVPATEWCWAPAFEVTAWGRERYRDIRSSVRAELLLSHELRILIGDHPATRYVEAGIGLAVGLDEHGTLTSVLIGPLKSDEITTLDAALGK
jgi:hypothetical protein